MSKPAAVEVVVNHCYAYHACHEHGFAEYLDRARREAAAPGAALDVWEATQGAFADAGWPPSSEQAAFFFKALERRGYSVQPLGATPGGSLTRPDPLAEPPR